MPLCEEGSDLIRVRSVVRVHPDPPFFPLKSILSEGFTAFATPYVY